LFPLSSQGLPRSLEGAPDELTRVLARSLRAETARVSIEEAAQMLDCTLDQRSCLESIASKMKVKRIIFGSVKGTDDGAMVKLTEFEIGERETERSIDISGETADEMADSLREAVDTDGKAKTDEKRIILETTPVEQTPAESGGVTTGTWAMIIGGGITTGVGAALLVSANNLRAQVSRAPTGTREEIDRLRALETAGRARVQIGGAMLAVGGVVTTVGIIRAIVQKRSPRPEEPRFDVVPESGGASVFFTMGWR
jgi:hypothetical protein